ncbi:hypothetical protein P7C70_g1276, partial [Phenoliferia sp. Uapishka_3]
MPRSRRSAAEREHRVEPQSLHASNEQTSAPQRYWEPQQSVPTRASLNRFQPSQAYLARATLSTPAATPSPPPVPSVDPHADYAFAEAVPVALQTCPSASTAAAPMLQLAESPDTHHSFAFEPVPPPHVGSIEPERSEPSPPASLYRPAGSLPPPISAPNQRKSANEEAFGQFLVAPPPLSSPWAADQIIETSFYDPFHRISVGEDENLYDQRLRGADVVSDSDGEAASGGVGEPEDGHVFDDTASYESENFIQDQLVRARESDGLEEPNAAVAGEQRSEEDGHAHDEDHSEEDSDHGGLFLFDDDEVDDDGELLIETVEGSSSDVDGAPVDLRESAAGESEYEPSRKRRRLSPPESPSHADDEQAGVDEDSEFEEGEIPDEQEAHDGLPSGVDLGDFSNVFSFFQQERSRLSSHSSERGQGPGYGLRDDVASFETSTPSRRPSGVPARLMPSSLGFDSSSAPIDPRTEDANSVDPWHAARHTSSRRPSTPLGPVPFPSYSRSDYDDMDISSSPVFGLSHTALAPRGSPVRHRQSSSLSTHAGEAVPGHMDSDFGDTTRNMDMSFDDLPADLVGDPTRRSKGPISILQRPLEKASYQRRAVPPPDFNPSTPLAGPASKISVFAANGVTYEHSSKATYVRPENGPSDTSGAQEASKSAYERRNGTQPIVPQPPPKKVPGALPLSQEEKAASVPAKLVAAFSELSLEEASSSRLYTPAVRSTPINKSIKGPDESALFGFWPAPPSLSSGKNVYPAPPVVEADPEDANRPRVDIFVDHSNVLYSFLNWARARPEAKIVNYVNYAMQQAGKAKVIKTVTIDGKKARLDYATFFALLERGRKVEKRVLVGSSPMWQSLEPAIEWSYEVSILQRVPRPATSAGTMKRKIPPPAVAFTAQVPMSTVKGALEPGATSKSGRRKKLAKQAKQAAAAHSKAQVQVIHGAMGGTAPFPHQQMYSTTHQQPVYHGSPMSGHMYPGVLDNNGMAPPEQQPRIIAKKPHHPAQKEIKSYKEQAVDELLHLKILESLLDFTPNPAGPRPVLVLATGDANSSEYNPNGFLGCVRRALDRGWDVEIIAFPMGTSSSWVGEAENVALAGGSEQGDGAVGGRGRLKVVDLAAFGEELLAL